MGRKGLGVCWEGLSGHSADGVELAVVLCPPPAMGQPHCQRSVTCSRDGVLTNCNTTSFPLP